MEHVDWQLGFSDVNTAVLFVAEHVEPEAIQLRHHQKLSIGDRVSFRVSLGDGDTLLEGRGVVGFCQEAAGAFRVTLTSLGFDTRNGIMFERIQLAVESLDGQGTNPSLSLPPSTPPEAIRVSTQPRQRISSRSIPQAVVAAAASGAPKAARLSAPPTTHADLLGAELAQRLEKSHRELARRNVSRGVGETLSLAVKLGLAVLEAEHLDR